MFTLTAVSIAFNTIEKSEIGFKSCTFAVLLDFMTFTAFTVVNINIYCYKSFMQLGFSMKLTHLSPDQY